MKRIRRSKHVEADLDITAFMNLMIVLVPVLLLGMVFSQITVVDVLLPDAAISDAVNSEKNDQLELVILKNRLVVNYPQGVKVKEVPVSEVGEHDFKLLSLTLQEVKRQLREKGIEKNNITILSQPDTSYQIIISTMDAVRSFKAVVAASVVDAALFPDVSFGDAPARPDETTVGDNS